MTKVDASPLERLTKEHADMRECLRWIARGPASPAQRYAASIILSLKEPQPWDGLP
jgi:hypothetical protein